MGAVISMSELLLGGPLDGTQRRYAETIHQSARSLLTVLNDLLDFSKLEAGRVELDLAAFDLHALIESTGRELRARANDKGVDSGVHVGMNCPRGVKGDAARLRQVLANLIDNAIKFTAHGAVHLHVNAGETDGKLILRFDVTDTGIGLSEQQKDRLFQPYVQADRAVEQPIWWHRAWAFDRAPPGRVNERRGRLQKSARPRQLFWLTISQPARRGARGERNACRRRPVRPCPRRRGQRREPHADRRLSRGVRAHPRHGPTGAEALQRLEASDYDLVLMDIMMPGLDGVEAKGGPQVRGVPRRGAHRGADRACDEGDREDYLAAGMDGYVSKPIRGRELYAALKPYLSAEDEGEPLVAVR